MYPGLTHGACNALEMHGTEAQKRTFLPNMIHGRWSGTMCLTEPHCGTDLGLIRTRAEPMGAGPDGEGRYKITGTKIFRSEEHTSELQSLMRISYAVFCLKKNKYSKN